MFGLGMGEIVVILMIILLLFGAKNLPEMAKALGKSMREFKNAMNEVKSAVNTEITKEDKPAELTSEKKA